MRLDTKEKRAAYRAAMIPAGAVRDKRSSDAGAAYTYEMAGRLYAMAFVGSAGKPAWHYRYRTEEQRAAKIEEFFASLQRHAEYKAANRASASEWRHDVKVGDIFRSSLGYDQTNIDYYEVVALVGDTMAEVVEIQQESEETAWLQGDCVPAPGKWATEPDYSPAGEEYKREHGHYPRKNVKPFRVRIQGGPKCEPYFKVRSFAHASRVTPVATVAGRPMYGASHWTAYH